MRDLEVLWAEEPDAARRERAVRALFDRTFGGEPEGLWAAPGRVNLIGEHIDYLGGRCLPLALPHRTVVAVRRAPDSDDGTDGGTDGVVRVVSEHLPDEPWEGRLADVRPAAGEEPGSVEGWAGYPVGVLWALAQEGWDVPAVEIAVASDVPVGAGLSSSAALTCSVALAVADLLGQPTDDEGRAFLAAACVRAENEVAGSATGGMDQQAALRAQADAALLIDTAEGTVEQVPLPLADAGLEVLVLDTRAPHRLVDGQYASRRAAADQAAEVLGVHDLARVGDLDGALARLDSPELRRRARHAITEQARVDGVVALLREGRLQDIGPLLDASHASLRDDYEVSSPELDVVTDAARRAGALGARMTGGGFGGSAVALVRTTDVDRVAEAVTAASADAGHPQPQMVRVVASAGAERVR